MADDVTFQSATPATPAAGVIIETEDQGGGVQRQVVQPRPQAGTLTDGSSDITAGGTSEQVFASNTSRVYLLVQNVSDTDMWVNFGTAAVQDQPSILLKAGGGAFSAEGNFVPSGSVNIICATTGKPYTAKEA